MSGVNYQRPDGSFDGSGALLDAIGGAARQIAPLFNGLQYKGWNQTYSPEKLRPGQPAASRYAKSRDENLQRINSDPRFVAPQPQPLAAVAPGIRPTTITLNSDQTRRSQLNAMSQQAGGPAYQQRLVPTEEEAQAINRRYASPEYWQSDAGKSMLALADGDKASEKSSLADLYEAQRAVGTGARDEIVSGLTAGLDAQKAEAIKTWATANPALALREFQKRFPKGEATTGPDDAAIREAMQQGRFFPAEGSPRPLQAGTTETTAPIEFPEISYQSAPAPYAPGGVVAAPFTQQETKVPVLGGDDGLPVVAPVNSQKFNLAGPDSPLPQINGAQALTERKTNELLLQHLAPLRMGGPRR